MNGYSIRMSKIDAQEPFKELAREMGGELSAENSLISFSGEMGHGQIRKWHLDVGLYMRVWDLYLSQPVEFIKEAVPVYIANNGFSLLCIQTPESVELKINDQSQKQFNKVGERRFALVPDSVNAGLQLAPEEPVQLIEFSMSAYWLKQRPGFIPVARYFDDGAEDNGMPVLIKPFPAKAGLLGRKLIDCLNHQQANTNDLLSMADVMIKEFLTTVACEETDKTSGNIDLYYEKIKEAEAILLSHLQSSPPRIRMIAKRVALSESTLKRYFKLIYGKSVYEYYLNRKMELAKILLLQQPRSVNEMAEVMGYEKVSHFIEIFKRYHGYSPGSVKKLLSY